MKRLVTASCLLSMIGVSPFLWAQIDQERQWSDSTGKFKIVARLIEVKDGHAYLKNAQGATLKIPIARLSKADQELLNNSDSPFEVIDDSQSKSSGGEMAIGGGQSGTAIASTTAENSWSIPLKIDWDEVEQLVPAGTGEWNVKLPESGSLGFQPKRAPLAKKSNFFEGAHPLAVNTVTKRAVVGYSVTFSVPKPLSRVSIVDLESGKSINSEQIESHMRPLTVLGNGTSVLMVGCGKDNHESPDQLQIWKLTGKKIARSAMWIPHPLEKSEHSKKSNANILAAYPVKDNLVLTIADHGYVVLWQIAQRKPVWHARLGGNFAIAPNADRSLLAIFDGGAVVIVRTETAEVLGSAMLEKQQHIAWPRLAWSPSGKKILFSTHANLSLLDLESGKWGNHFSIPGMVQTGSLDFPDEDYALLDNRLLVHLPTRIQVCDYRDAGHVETLGGTSFISLLGDSGGLLVPTHFPHPAAAKILDVAKTDPSVFLIRPGTLVSIDVSGVSPEYQAEVRNHLEKAASNSGYVVATGANIILSASISGPTQEAVSYIARGSYIVNKFTSSIKLKYQDKDLWQASASNVPGMLMTRGDQTIEQALIEYGKRPNTSFYEGLQFPQYMQKPSEQKQPGRPQSNALMTSKFTLQGLVDDQ